MSMQTVDSWGTLSNAFRNSGNPFARDMAERQTPSSADDLGRENGGNPWLEGDELQRQAMASRSVSRMSGRSHGEMIPVWNLREATGSVVDHQHSQQSCEATGSVVDQRQSQQLCEPTGSVMNGSRAQNVPEWLERVHHAQFNQDTSARVAEDQLDRRAGNPFLAPARDIDGPCNQSNLVHEPRFQYNTECVGCGQEGSWSAIPRCRSYPQWLVVMVIMCHLTWAEIATVVLEKKFRISGKMRFHVLRDIESIHGTGTGSHRCQPRRLPDRIHLYQHVMVRNLDMMIIAIMQCRVHRKRGSEEMMNEDVEVSTANRVKMLLVHSQDTTHHMTELFQHTPLWGVSSIDQIHL